MFKFTDNTITTEITKGVYLNLKAEYKWNSDTELDLKLSWEPHSSEGPYSASSLTTSFSSPLGELNINGTRIGNQTLENTYNTTLTNINSNAQNITITFKYVNGNALVDLTQDFNKLIIPKPNKYDNNVVFNRDGLNEMIDYFLKYPVRSIEESENYGHITIAHGKDEAEDIHIKGLEHNDAGLTITTNLLPNEDATYDLGVKDEENENNNLRWKNLYLSNNANVDGVVKANELEGLLTGGGININDNFIVDSDGNVQMKGSITGLANKFICLYHKGLWENSNYQPPQPFEEIKIGNYEEKIINNASTYDFYDLETSEIMEKNTSWIYLDNKTGQYYYYDNTKYILLDRKSPALTELDHIEEEDVPTIDLNKRWHKKLNSNGQDHWKTITFDGGEHWSDPEYINPSDGAPGGWNNNNILQALTAIDQDGIYTFEGGKMGVRASALVSILARFGKIDMGVLNPDQNSFASTNYWAGNNKSLIGGYITFPIPAPFQVDNNGNYATDTQIAVINNNGWRGRLGYIRGNGNGLFDQDGTPRGTAGMGIVIYTNATFFDIYGKDMEIATMERNADDIPYITNDYVTKHCHLILSLLMLTDSGLGLMTATNMQNVNSWIFKDTMKDEDVGQNAAGNDAAGNYPHYYYRWWSGFGESSLKDKDKNKRIARLWLHEDNGGLYYSWNNDDPSLRPWNWAG